MANTYYDSQLDAEQIENALRAVNGVVAPANNGKVLAISNGKIVARSVQWGGGSAVLEPLSVTENGDYYPESGVDGFDEVHVSVPTGGSPVIQSLSITQNGTYTAPSGVDGYSPVVVNVSGGGGNKPQSAGVITSQNVIVDYNAQTLETFFSEKDFLFDFDALVGYIYTKSQLASDIDSAKSYTCYIVCRENAARMARLMGFAGAGEGTGHVPGIYSNSQGIVYTTLYSSDVSTGISATNFFAACVIIDRSNNQVRYAVNSYRETKNATMYGWNKVSVNGQNNQYVGQMEIKHFAFIEGADDASTVDANISALMTLYGIQ